MNNFNNRINKSRWISVAAFCAQSVFLDFWMTIAKKIPSVYQQKQERALFGIMFLPAVLSSFGGAWG